MGGFIDRIKWLLFGGDIPIEHNFKTARRGAVIPVQMVTNINAPGAAEEEIARRAEALMGRARNSST